MYCDKVIKNIVCQLNDLRSDYQKQRKKGKKEYSKGTFEVTKVRMADDLLQEGLLKKDKKAASFMTIGEPDVRLLKSSDTSKDVLKSSDTSKVSDDYVQVEIARMDIYDPIKDEVKSFNREDIAYLMIDDNYNGANFAVKQVNSFGAAMMNLTNETGVEKNGKS